jgi:hypothetical protein
LIVDYPIEYCSEELEDEILPLPGTLAARDVVLTRRMTAVGSNSVLRTLNRSAKACSNHGWQASKESHASASAH